MKGKLLSLTILLVVSKAATQTLPGKISESDFCIGKSMTIESSILNEARDLNIYLPLNYSVDSLKTYPVIYLFDGSKDEDFIHISGIVQFGSFSWINMIPESIVVGIGNVDRRRDFTYPSNSKRDQKEFPTTGKSEYFIQFLETEVQPFIDATFRTNQIKTVIGQSLGGLLATEILIKKPNLFDNYIIVSPSLWWDDEKLLDNEFTSLDSIESIYVAVGKEGEVMERTAEELFRKIEKHIEKDNNNGPEYFFELFEDKTHGDVLHVAAYNALEKIFKPTKE